MMIDDALAISECGPDSIKVNALIQSKVEMKHLKLGHGKCFKMNVGKNKTCCAELKVHDKEMLTSDRECYLGDLITSDGKINANIEDRYNKGIGIANQIISMLKEVSFGNHYFEMATLFRQSMLINSILCNSEVLYGLTKSHIETLESVDKYYWRKVFESIISTPTESYYIETNTIPFRYILMSRRIMYYWNISQKDDSELVKKFFMTQKSLVCKNDWVLQLKSDLKECNISLSEEEIMKMKRTTFKSFLKRKINAVAKQYLFELRSSHSKSTNLLHKNELKDYLSSDKISLEGKKLLFSMKTRGVNVKTNFKNGYSDLMCRFCQKQGEDESETHLLHCEKVICENNLRNIVKDIKYSDIFGTIEQQINASKVWCKIFNQT